jgi:D-alanyl-D-alanine dipeptidase
MEQISKNFKMSEFKTTSTGLPNEIPDDVKPAIRALVLNLLQPVCDAMGWRCKINSGYRSPAVNMAVGGVTASQHLTGEAADCVFLPEGLTALPIDVLRAVIELGLAFDQMIAYPNFVHLSYTTKRANRRQVLYNKSYMGVRL